MLPLNCSLNSNPIFPQNDDREVYLFTSLDQPAVLADKHELSTLNLCLFGDTSSLFDSTSESLILHLVSQLLGINHLQYSCLSSSSINKAEWFYHGAPCVAIVLSIGDNNLHFYMHPQRVLESLQSPTYQPKPKAELQDALSSHRVHCQVELDAFSLQVKDTLNLQVGDVIQTDHLLCASLFLKHQQQTICQVEPGRIQQHKSIQIVS